MIYLYIIYDKIYLKMRWSLQDLNEWINNGCDNKIALQITELYLSCHNLTTIPREIGNLINLQKLDLSSNGLTTIPNEIYNLINLQTLDLSNNNFITISEKIGNLRNLKVLELNFNKLTTIPAEIGNLINLQILNLYVNDITTIPNKIGNLINLQYLNLSYNNLTKIPNEIGNLRNLQEISLFNNNLRTIPIEITNIRNVSIFFSNNPIEYISPQVVRYLYRNKTRQKIYNDSQSVHNHSIQEGITKSINYIMSIKPMYKLNNINDVIINNNFIDNQTKTILFEYINCQDIHSILNVTFAELLINVLSFIDKHKAKKEIYKVLKQEMNDTLCKCFTGRMSRLINSLNGFDDHIIINISDNEQIGNIIILIKDKLLEKNNYTIELHKEIVMKELYDRGYDKGIIDEWIEYI
jgi:Leucine-rich repeat (LRR) protein